MKFVNDDDTIKEAFSEVTVGLSWESLRSPLENIEHTLIGIIGEESIPEIIADDTALARIRQAIVSLALEKYSSTGSIQVSNSGVHVSKSDKLLPASDKKLLAFRRECRERGWIAFEQLITILESKKNSFKKWADSNERAKYLNCFFHSSAEFSSFAGLSISADLFQIIKPQISFVEDDVLSNTFGENFVNELRTKLLDGGLSSEDKKLLRYFLRILGPLSIVEAIPYRMVQLTESGVYQTSISTFGNQADNVEGQSIVQQRILGNLMIKLSSEGEACIVKAQKWLNENSLLFPLYKNARVYPFEDFNSTDSNVYLS